MSSPHVNRIYRHYKGGVYVVRNLGTLTSNGGPEDRRCAIYEGLGTRAAGPYVRPVSEWEELTDKGYERYVDITPQSIRRAE